MALIIKQTENGTIYECSCCGQAYNELPLAFGNDFQDYYIPPDEPKSSIEIAPSLLCF